MDDPRRLLDSGASELERSLLRAAVGDRPTAKGAAKVAAAIGVACSQLAGGTVVAATAAAAKGIGAAAAKGIGAATILKSVGLVALGGVLGVTATQVASNHGSGSPRHPRQGAIVEKVGNRGTVLSVDTFALDGPFDAGGLDAEAVDAGMADAWPAERPYDAFASRFTERPGETLVARPADEPADEPAETPDKTPDARLDERPDERKGERKGESRGESRDVAAAGVGAARVLESGARPGIATGRLTAAESTSSASAMAKPAVAGRNALGSTAEAGTAPQAREAFDLPGKAGGSTTSTVASGTATVRHTGPPTGNPLPASGDRPPASDIRQAATGGRPRGRASAEVELPEEIRCLDVARTALDKGDPPAAIDALDYYERRFPGGVLAPEAVVLRVDALEQKGDTAEAILLAKAFLEKYPGSPLAARIRRVLRLERQR
ncbi:MAG: tetratricopeptide repeat protein [Pseudomonadota bacterium]